MFVNCVKYNVVHQVVASFFISVVLCILGRAGVSPSRLAMLIHMANEAACRVI